MEIVAKVVITIIVVFTGFKILTWTWTSHIDCMATIHKLFKQEPKIADVVVTRDPSKLYQEENIVAEVNGNVDIKNGRIIFEQISNTSNLDTNKIIEYKRFKLKIIHINSRVGMKSVVSDSGSRVLQNVMEGVICEELK